MNTHFELSENEEHGAVLKITGIELADEFDDFLNEDCYVFSELNFKSNCVDFYFGQASCVEKIRDLIDKFEVKEKTNQS